MDMVHDCYGAFVVSTQLCSHNRQSWSVSPNMVDPTAHDLPQCKIPRPGAGAASGCPPPPNSARRRWSARLSPARWSCVCKALTGNDGHPRFLANAGKTALSSITLCKIIAALVPTQLHNRPASNTCHFTALSCSIWLKHKSVRPQSSSQYRTTSWNWSI